MWMGFGQTVSQLSRTYDGPTWAPKKPTSIDHCPESWLNYTTPAPAPPSETFLHLPLYEVSYMWFSAIACMWVVVVGALVSLVTGPQDPLDLDRRLISPGLPGLFSCWPARVRLAVKDYYMKIGKNFVSKQCF